MNPTQVNKSRIHNMMATHVQRMDPVQVHECCVRDGCLGAVAYTEPLDPVKVHEDRVRDGRLLSPGHVERVDPAVASVMVIWFS